MPKGTLSSSGLIRRDISPFSSKGKGQAIFLNCLNSQTPRFISIFLDQPSPGDGNLEDTKSENISGEGCKN